MEMKCGALLEHVSFTARRFVPPHCESTACCLLNREQAGWQTTNQVPSSLKNKTKHYNTRLTVSVREHTQSHLPHSFGNVHFFQFSEYKYSWFSALWETCDTRLTNPTERCANVTHFDTAAKDGSRSCEFLEKTIFAEYSLTVNLTDFVQFDQIWDYDFIHLVVEHNSIELFWFFSTIFHICGMRCWSSSHWDRS